MCREHVRYGESCFHSCHTTTYGQTENNEFSVELIFAPPRLIPPIPTLLMTPHRRTITPTSSISFPPLRPSHHPPLGTTCVALALAYHFISKIPSIAVTCGTPPLKSALPRCVISDPPTAAPPLLLPSTLSPVPETGSAHG